MSAITADRLLRAWEATLDKPPSHRGVTLLAGCRDDDPDAVARWAIAQRDVALYDLRHELFGACGTAVADCPACAEHLEIPLDLRALRPGDLQADDAPITVQGYLVRTRPPNTDDLAAISDMADEESAVSALLARCVESVITPLGNEIPATDLPAAVGSQLRPHLARRVEDVDIQLALSCAGCGTSFRMPFDITVFLLREVDVWASRLLREVHVLAREYGWDESVIVRLSPRRRRAYIELVEAAP